MKVLEKKIKKPEKGNWGPSPAHLKFSWEVISDNLSLLKKNHRVNKLES